MHSEKMHICIQQTQHQPQPRHIPGIRRIDFLHVLETYTDVKHPVVSSAKDVISIIYILLQRKQKTEKPFEKGWNIWVGG